MQLTLETPVYNVKEGIDKEVSSNTYHSIPGVYSSSQIKDAWKDVEFFHAKYIKKTVEKEHIAAFDIGTYFHTAILEPDKLTVECAVYEGKRYGKAWDEFQAANAGKAIITKTEHETAQALIRAVQRSPVAMKRLKRGEPEVSAFLKIRVYQGAIYAITWKKILGKYGWQDTKSIPAKGTDIWVKTRADLLAESFILDLKSMSDNAKDDETIRKTVSNYNYDLSAALYLDVFGAVNQRLISEFIWTFASKNYVNSRSYLATEKCIQIGRHKWKTAILRIADGIETDWSFEDYMGMVNPPVWDLELIKEKEENLL
jgi:exodeoxyribonuclease VIII